MPAEWDALIRFAFPAGRSADTPEPLLCRAWYLAAGAVFGEVTVFTGFITPRRSASVVTSRKSVTSSASSRRFKVSERFFGSVTLGCSKGSLSGIDGSAPGVGYVAVIKLCEWAGKHTYAPAGDRCSAAAHIEDCLASIEECAGKLTAEPADDLLVASGFRAVK
jgi:hypothetical protein